VRRTKDLPDDWLEMPEPVGYEIEERDGFYTAFMVSEYKDGRRDSGALIIASSHWRGTVERRARKFVDSQRQIWRDQHDPNKKTRVIMYQKPPSVPPKGPSGISTPRRSRR